MPSLVEIFYYLFLVIFALTALTALGSVMQVRPFHRVPEKYRARLFTVLIVEVIGAVLLVFRNLPTPGGSTIDHYRFEAVYHDYEVALRASLAPEERACLEAAAPKDQRCAQVQSELEAARASRGGTGQGSLLMVGKTGESPTWGVLVYTFPRAADPTAIRVTAAEARGNFMRLRFIQAERPLVRGEAVFVRPQQSYEIEFSRNAQGRHYEGTVFHPQRRTQNGKPLELARAILIPQ